VRRPCRNALAEDIGASHREAGLGGRCAQFDIGVYGGEIVIAAARRWHERWGAEPVALWGTMMQFTVSHRPATPDDAWMLAREHDILAANTLSNPGIPLRDHARALTILDRWFLHSRP